jgi:DNA-binding MarR family transcriptional regulator
VTSAIAVAGPIEVADQLIDLLAPLLAEQRRRWAERCQARGLSVVGFQTLSLLQEREAMPMSRLADELDVAPPNASAIVGRLAERGLVERIADPTDRRIVRVRLTDQGRGLLDEIEEARLERLRRLIGSLDPIQQRRLLRSVRDLVAATRSLGPFPETT